MKNTVTVVVAGFVALLVSAGSYAFLSPVRDSVNQSLGANAGPDSYEHSSFFSGLGRGGFFATSTDDTTATFLAGNLNGISRIDFTPNVTGITATLPASSTLTSFVTPRGMTRDILLCNATTTTAAPFTLAFGAGMIDSLATTTLAIESGDCAQLTFSRKGNTDIDVFYDLGY